ncbi:Golgi membrane exchange factor (Ric1p-Rgp1p) subunit, partial [Elasticomyces elasticus]
MPPPPPRAMPRRHMRHHSSVDPSPLLANGQSLLMGYAQVSASFTVDGSLINQSAFEEVKRKGVVGGQGSGSTGPPPRTPRGDKSRKGGGGFWGALRWNNIEESLSGLLANNELDGLREMRGVSSSRSIPLLSTSQSLLFVDLRLAPGEEQSYSFSFTLPSGLPASHKGKAIKISYNLVIGTQRPSGPGEPQRVNRINVPFRVFSGVNGQGQILGHNLMSPYVLLRDEARVQKIGRSPSPAWKQQQTSLSEPMWTSAPDFLSYVDEILEQRSRGNSLQPPDTPAERRELHHASNTTLSCKDAIDLAVLRSNQAATNTTHSPNRFEIARG